MNRPPLQLPGDALIRESAGLLLGFHHSRPGPDSPENRYRHDMAIATFIHSHYPAITDLTETEGQILIETLPLEKDRAREQIAAHLVARKKSLMAATLLYDVMDSMGTDFYTQKGVAVSKQMKNFLAESDTIPLFKNIRTFAKDREIDAVDKGFRGDVVRYFVASTSVHLDFWSELEENKQVLADPEEKSRVAHEMGHRIEHTLLPRLEALKEKGFVDFHFAAAAGHAAHDAMNKLANLRQELHYHGHDKIQPGLS